MNHSTYKPCCIIPARGGSKRFPRKNIALLGGKPLLAWSIQCAKQSGLFDVVWISSEDQEILEIAEKWGGTALLRSEDLATDEVMLTQLLWHLIQQPTLTEREYTHLYLMLPTSPFRRKETICEAWNHYLASDAESLMSVVPTSYPPQWALTVENGWLKPMFPNDFETPRPQIPPTVKGDGGHVITKISSFLQSKVFLGSRTLAFFVAAEESVDIDEPMDLEWAEFLLQKGMVSS